MLKKQTINLSLLALLIGTVFLFTVNVRAQKNTQQAGNEPTIWEYKVMIPNETGPDQHERRRANIETQLLEAGSDGWEFVETAYLKGVRYQVMILKRPKTK
jgi:hypothetical protein